jgi:hypothetical protein
MSKEREVIAVGDQTKVPTEEESRAQKKARLAQVLDRGIVGDRLKVDLPSHVHGEWVFNDQTEVMRMEALGFKVDTEYAPKRALHSKGDGASYVGDVVFMTCEKETKALIDEIKQEQYMRLNRKGKKQKEERDFDNLTSKEGLETLSEGSINDARKEAIEQALGINPE